MKAIWKSFHKTNRQTLFLGRCDQYDVCKRHICHEDGMSCSVTGSYSLFGSLDAASVQPTDLKSDWILMAIAFLLIVFVSVAVFARRHQKRYAILLTVSALKLQGRIAEELFIQSWRQQTLHYCTTEYLFIAGLYALCPVL